MASKYRSAPEQEIQDYLSQVRQGQAGQDPAAQTLARSTGNPEAQRQGERAMAIRTRENLANVEEANREQIRADKAAAADAKKMERQQSKDAEAARARGVRAAAAEGAKTITDVETGKRTIATHPDGATVFESGPISPIKPIGEVGQTLQDTQTGEKRAVPNSGIMLGDTGGVLGATGTERQTVFGQEVRDNRGNVSVVSPETKTDPKTGQITFSQKNETTGRTEDQAAGIDWQTREIAARKQQNAQDEQAAMLEGNAAMQARAAFNPRWQPVKAEYLKAKSELEALPSPLVRKGSEWVHVDERTGKETMAISAEVEYQKKRREEAQARFDRAKAAHDPMAAQNEQITLAERSARDKRLKAAEDRIRIEAGLPDDTSETLTRMLAAQTPDVTTPEHEAAAQVQEAATAAQGAPAPTPAPDTPETRDAFQSISGLSGVTTKNEGPYTTLHRNGRWIASIETADGHPALTLKDAAANEAEVMAVVRQTNGGIPVYVKDNPNRPKATFDAQQVAQFLSLAHNSGMVSPETAKQYGLDPVSIRRKVADGLMSVQVGEAALKPWGDSLKTDDWKDPATFQKWLETSSKQADAALNDKYGRTDLKAQGTAKQRLESAKTMTGRSRTEALQVKLDFVRDWALKNAGKPGVTRSEIAKAYASQDPGISKLDPLNAGHSLVTMARDSVVASMVGLAGGFAADLGAAEMALFGSEDAAKTLKEDMQLRNRDFANWTNAAKRNAKVWATKDGQAAMSKLDTSLAVLKNAIDQEADSPTPDSARIDAAESAVRQSALALHNLAPDESWPMTLDTLDANKDKALGSSLADYMATGDPRSFELYRERLLMNNGRRQYSAEIQKKLGSSTNGFFNAMTSAQYAGWQEAGSELVADAAMLATGGASKALQAGLKAAGAAGKASKVARLSAAVGRGLEAIEKFGTVENTLQKPLTVMQKMRNAAVSEIKAAAGEGGEEVIVEPGSDNPQIADAFLGGFIAPLGIIPAQIAAHQMAKTAAGPIDEKAEAQRSQKWAAQFNAAMVGTPGFQAVTPDQAKVAANFVNPKQYLDTTSKIAAAMDNLQSAQGETEMDSATRGKLRAGLDELSTQLAKQTAEAVTAAQAVDSLADPQEKAFYGGIAKVATGNTAMLTQAERSAVQGRTTREGAPFFAQVAQPDGSTREVLTDEARAEIMADMPAVGALITTSESQAIFEAQTAAAQPQPTAPNGQDLQGQPGSQAAPQNAQPAPANPNAPGGAGTAGSVQQSPTPPTNTVGATGTSVTPEQVASFAGSDAGIYEAARQANPSLPSISEIVTAARAAGQPVSPSMAKIADEAAPTPNPNETRSKLGEQSPANTGAPTDSLPDGQAAPSTGGATNSSSRSIADRVKSTVETALPGVSGRVRIKDQAFPGMTTGGALANPDGTIDLILPDIEAQLGKFSPQDVEASLLQIVQEHEVTHVVQYQAVMALWEESGKQGSFSEFFQNWYGKIAGEISPEAFAAARKIYGETAWDSIKSDSNRAAELVRMLVEASRPGADTGRFSELMRALQLKQSPTLIETIRKAVELLVEMVRTGKLPESVKAHVDQISALYDKLAATEQTPAAPEITEDMADSLQVVNSAINDALESNPDIKANDDLRIALDDTASDLAEIMAGMPADQRRAFVDAAIADWIDENAEIVRQAAQDAADAAAEQAAAGKSQPDARARQKAAREAYKARIREKARAILNSDVYSALSSIFARGAITPKPHAIPLILARKKAGKKLTEKEIGMLRNLSEWDGAPRKSDFTGGGNNTVVREIIDMLYAPRGKGQMPDQIADGLTAKITTASEMFEAIDKELTAISRGKTLIDEQAPDFEGDAEAIAKAEAERAALPPSIEEIAAGAADEFGPDSDVAKKADLFAKNLNRFDEQAEALLLDAMLAETGRIRAGVPSAEAWQSQTSGWSDDLKRIHKAISTNTPESLRKWVESLPVIEDEWQPQFSSGPNGRPSIQTTDGGTLEAPGIVLFASTAYHGTPHKVDRFRLDKIGTGEGAQAYGWGLYFAENEDVASQYQRNLAKWTMDGSPIRQDPSVPEHEVIAVQRVLQLGYAETIERAIDGLRTDRENFGPEYGANFEKAADWLDANKERFDKTGNLYTVRLKVEDNELLDWDKPMIDQLPAVRERMADLMNQFVEERDSSRKGTEWYEGRKQYESRAKNMKASEFYSWLSRPGYELRDNNPAEIASRLLANFGIKGIRYLDGNSRSGGQGSYNYVIFDENDIEILEENGQPVQPMALFSSAPQGSFDFGASGDTGTKTQKGFDFGSLPEGENAKFQTNAQKAMDSAKTETAKENIAARVAEKEGLADPKPFVKAAIGGQASFDFGTTAGFETRAGQMGFNFAGKPVVDAPANKAAKPFSKASTQINLPEPLAQRIRDFAATIPDSELYTAEEGFGREDELHTTVLYGLTSDDAKQAKAALKDFGPITFNLGKLSLFENEKYDVLKIEVDGKSLHLANKALRDSVDFENDYPDYKPHVTVAYLKSGEGKKYVGGEQFEGETVTSDSVLYSGKDRTKTTITVTPSSPIASAPVVAKSATVETPTPATAEEIAAENPKFVEPIPQTGPEGFTPEQAASELAKRGITIEKDSTKTGKTVWRIMGKTFDVKDHLKAMGAKWFGPAKAWSIFSNEDPTQAIADTLAGKQPAAKPTTGGEPGATPDGNDAGTDGKPDEDLRLRQLRDRLDKSADERRTRSDAVETVNTSTADLIRRGLQYGMPAEVVEDQIEDIAMITRAYDAKKPMFLLGNGAGTGKTFVLGGAIRELRAAGAKNFVYVTMNTDLIAQIKRDLADFGIQDVSFHTYSELSGKSGVFLPDDAVLIFDEAHNVKNSDSARGERAQPMMARAKFTIFASATPFENPVEASYLAGTGVFNEAGGHTEWGKAYGANVRKYKVMTPYGMQERETLYWTGGKLEDGLAARQWFVRQGIMVTRPMRLPMHMVESQFTKRPVTAQYVEIHDRINAAYDEAMSAFRDEDGNILDARNNAMISMHQTNTIKRVLEAAKIDHAVEEANRILDAGGNIVLFVETKADRFIGRYRASQFYDKSDRLYTYPEIREMMAEWQIMAGMARMSNEAKPPRPFAEFIVQIARAMHEAGIEYELPSVEEQIVEKLGGTSKVAIYTGSVSNSAASKDKEAFLAGKKRVIVATMAKGGTGLSLHDKVGNRETWQVNLNLPWRATGVDQVSGRVARYGLQSKAHINWLFADNIPFERMLAGRVGRRMRDMGALVKGIDMKAARVLTDEFDFQGSTDVKQREGEVSAPDVADDIWALAERLEKSRSKASDTSMGFFETPYPIAALMTEVSGARGNLLEPSGGRGNLVRFVKDNPKVTSIRIIEARSDNADYLKGQYGDRVTQGDFLDEADALGKFDTIHMNPPFERLSGVGAQDVAHVMKAFDLLEDDGRLVAIMGEGAFFRNYQQEREFRAWLDERGAIVVKLPENAFKNSGTGVRTRMVILDKNGEAGRTDIDLEDMDTDSMQSVADAIPTRDSIQMFSSAPQQANLFAAATAPDAAEKLGQVKVGKMNALAAYRTLTAKRDAGKTLDAREEQQLLDAEQALGQKLAFDMDAVKGEAPATVKQSLQVPPPVFGQNRRDVQDEMSRAGEVDSRGQISLLSSPAEQSAFEKEKAGILSTAKRGSDGHPLAPNGERSNLTEDQWAAVRTKNFKRWFGDWEKFTAMDGGVWNDSEKSVSKAVDENGEPLVVYHGSKEAGFDTFDPSKSDSRLRPDSVFFSDSRRTARTYSGSLDDVNFAKDEDGEPIPHRAIYAVFLNIRNPQEYNFEGANWDGRREGQFMVVDADGEQIYSEDGRGYFQDEDEAKAVADANDGAEVVPAEDSFETTNSAAMEAKRYGSDGAIIRDVMDDGGEATTYDTSNVFVVFDETQVKSAVANNGKFSSDPSILFASAPAAWPPNLYAYTYAKETSRGETKHVVKGFNEKTGAPERRVFDTFAEAKQEMDRLDDLAAPPKNFKFSLASSPASEDAIQQALSKMHPIYREVFNAVNGGATPADVMAKFNITEKAVTNILNQVRSRIVIASKASAGTLEPQMQDGKFAGGRPDLAEGAKPDFVAVDQIRNESGIPDTVSMAENYAEADRRLAADYEGEFSRLENMAMQGAMPNRVDVAISREIFRRETLSGGLNDPQRRARVALFRVSYRDDFGTEQARAFQMRRDEAMTPAERNALHLAELMYEPSPSVRDRMKSADAKTKDEILKQWMEQIDAFKAEMKADGYDIDASLAAFQAHQDSVKQAEEVHSGTKAAMDEAMMKLSKREKTVIKLIRDGAKLSTVMRQTGMTKEQVMDVKHRFGMAWREAIIDAGRRFASNSLASSAPRDIYEAVMGDLGWQSDEDFDDTAPDYFEKQDAKRKDAKARERKRKQLEAPKEKPLTPEQQQAINEAFERFKNADPSTWTTLFETEAKNLTPIIGQVGFEEFKGKVLRPWRDRWQTEMDGIANPSARISFEEWIAKPSTQTTAKRERELFPQPINETTGTFDTTLPNREGTLFPQPINPQTGTWSDARPYTGQGELIREEINETTGTFDINDPVAIAHILNENARRQGSWINKLTEFYKMAILSGPQTMLVNASGGLYAGYDLTAKRAAEAAWNGIMGLFGQADVRSATFSEFLPMLKQVRAAASLAARNAVSSWELQSPVFESYASAKPIQLDFSGVGPEYAPPATTSAISRFLRNITFRELTAVDEFWKGMFAQLDVAGLAHRIAAKEEGLSGDAYAARVEELMKPGSKAWLRTLERTKRATFQDSIAYGKWTKEDERKNPAHKEGTPMTWQQALKKSETESTWTLLDAMAAKATEARKTPFFGPLLHMFALPFIATPKNMIQRGLEVTPLGLVIDLIDGMRSLRRRVYSGNITKAESNRIAAELYNNTRFIQTLTNQTMGIMIYLAVESLNGGDDDDEYGRPHITGTLPFSATKKGERDTAQAVMPPQSIRIGDTIIPYGRIEPFATAVSAIVDVVASAKRNEGYNAQVVTDSVVGMKEQFKDKLFLKGLGDIIRVIEDPSRGADRLAAGYVTGFIPNIVRQPVREIDSTIRDTNPQANDGFFTAVGKRVGYSVVPQAAPAKLDVWGNPIPANRGDLIGGTKLTDSMFRVFDPFNIRAGGKIRPIDAWIFHYNMTQPDSSQRIGIETLGDEVTVKLPGENKPRKIALTAQEHEEAIKRVGQAAQSFLGDDWDWKTATDADASQKAEIIKDTFTNLKRAEMERLKIKKTAELAK